METLLKGTQKAVELSEIKVLKKFVSKLHDISVLGCTTYTFISDEYWKCLMKHFAFSNYRVSGTCKIEPVSNEEAVVEPRLRVHGINGLRVIDASIIPNITDANKNAPTIMIGEKVADLIKEDWVHKG